MKNHILFFVLAVLCLNANSANAQTSDSTVKFGVWQFGAAPLSSSIYPQISGRFSTIGWGEIETAPDVWDWTAFDSSLSTRVADGLPVMFKVYVKEQAPAWLYTTGGVPKVIEKDVNGVTTGYSPYYLSSLYNFYFKRMITKVRLHVESLSPSIRNKVVAVQGCFGSTGDYISYKGTVAPQYDISTTLFDSLYRVYSAYYYNEYKNTNPKITLISNPGNNNSAQSAWLIANCPNTWFKTGSLGKGYQLNDEKSKSDWLYSLLNTPQNGSYVRARCEITGDNLTYNWWLNAKYKNMFALLSNCIYWGVDWSNQTGEHITDANFNEAFNFFNKYAGQKNPATATNAMCALRDGLDASDAVRFPVATYGAATRSNSVRYKNIANSFTSFGAKLEDSATAVLYEGDNLDANGTNDVGWNIFTGNYDRYLHQLNANTTSVGYWNVSAPNDPNTVYGKYARGFDLANSKNALYFDVENAFLNNAPLNSQQPVMITVVYLDNGTGGWKLYYDAQAATDKVALNVTCANSGLWKKAYVTLTDAYFGNRANSASDFYIKSTNTQNVIFSLVELERPNATSSNVGFSSSAITAFDTLCINSTSGSKSFNIKGAFLSGSAVKVGPLAGYKFSTSANGTYSDSVTITNYGITLSQTMYVKFSPATSGSFNGSIPVSGGNVTTLNVPVQAVGVNSKPTLTGAITNITCNNAKNGVIDLTTTGGAGVFSYSWTLAGVVKYSTQDISGLTPGDYIVAVTSLGGCTTNKTFTVTEPAVLAVAATADNMICKDGTTNVYVTATGGTLPYTGTGTIVRGKGSNQFTVTDPNGCTARKTITIANGTLQAPVTPGVITGSTDPSALCNGGNFNYSITAVTNATSYTWIPPAGTTVSSTTGGGTQIVLSVPSGLQGDSIYVKANNTCGSSATKALKLSTVPVAPSSISGSTSVAPSKTGLVYSVTAVSGLSYTWTVPPGATIVSGQNTASVTVNWGIQAGNVTVKAVTNCGSSPVTTLPVSVVSGGLTASVASLPAFSTMCVNGVSSSKTFSVTITGANGTNLVVGPLAGYKFAATTNGTYTDTMFISYTGTTTTKSVYVKFQPLSPATYAGNIPISGGGASATSVSVSGIAVNSIPVLSAVLTNITCNGLKNGAIDLSLTGGTGPFTYNWAGTGPFDTTAQDIIGLSAVNYTVTVGSYAGCSTSATYTLTQPAALVASLTADNMICKNTNANVYVTATGGTLPYSGTGTFAGVSGANSYTVTDSKGCTNTKSITVPNGTGVAPATPALINGTASDASGLCGGGNFNYYIDPVATATSYTWTAPAGSSIASINAGGTQIVMTAPSNFSTGSLAVTANNGCGASTAATKTLSSIPAAPGVITGPTSITAAQTGLTYSVVQVPGVTYTWTVPGTATIVSGQNTSSVTVNWGNATGKIKVSAVKSCGVSTLSTLDVTVGTVIKLYTSVTSLPFDPTCVNTSNTKSFQLLGILLNGSNITVGSVPGYTYSTTANGTFTNSLTVSGYSIPLNQVIYVKFSPVASANYNGNISISGGGVAAFNVGLSGTGVSSAPALSNSITNVSCNGLQNGTVNLTLTGGTGPFGYSWTNNSSNISSNEDLSGLTAGTYNITVTSLGGCAVSATANVTQPAILNATTTAGTILCNGGSTSILVSASGGTAPYTGVGTFNVGAGTYNYTVTDSKGCSTSKSVTVGQPAILTASASAGSILCNGSTTTVNISAAGGTAPYTGTGAFTAGAGTQTYTVTDANGCSVNKSVTITEPSALNASVASGTILCNGGTTTVTVSAAGGSAPYTGTGTFTVGAGTYTYTVTDANGCTKTKSITISEPSAVSVISSGGLISCNGGTAVVSISGAGGVSPYTGTGNFTVSGGTYSYTITDANGCSATKTLTVNEPAILTATATAGAILPNGNTPVTIDASGGTTPYTGTGTFTEPAGLHNYTVTDTHGCTTSTSIIVGEADTLVASATANQILCNGGTTTVTVSATGGIAPYTGTGNFTVSAGTHTYTITDFNGNSSTATITVTEPDALTASSVAGTILCHGGTTTVTIDAQGGMLPYSGAGNFTATSGTHNYTVADANGCTKSTSISITQPSALSVSANADPITIAGGTTTVVVSAVGGVAPYTGTGNFTVVAGTYNYQVDDSNGCSATKNITVSEPGVLIASSNAGIINCNGGTATVTVDATGGTAPYTGTGNYTVSAGTYSYTVTDAVGATSTTTVTVTEPSAFSASANAGTILCKNGTATVTISGAGGVTPYTGTGNFTANAGTHSYTITDANNCTTVTQVTLVEPALLTASASSGAILCNGGTTTINVGAAGGTAPYTGADNFTVEAGTYTYTVTDANGCTATKTKIITQPAPLVASANAPTINCVNATTTVAVTATGGVSPYTGTGNFTVGAGTYSYTITDANGCTSTQSVTLASGTQNIPAKPTTLVGADTGSTGLCGGGVFVYHTDPVPAATSYTWSVPNNTTISGTNVEGNQIVLTVPSGIANGSISVTADNICGSSAPLIKSLTAEPGQPTVITGPVSVQPLKNKLVYSVLAIPGLSYTWSVPSGASIDSGQNTSSINVTWGTISGNVTVQAANSCGISPATNLYVNVTSGDITPSITSLPAFADICVNGTSTGQSFTMNASGLNGSDVVVGPVPGFKFASGVAATYGNTLVISGYGTTLNNRSVFVKFNPATVGAYSVDIPINGGGANPITVGASGLSVNSSPALSAAITNITCNGSKNGVIDLSITGGTGPFTYDWTGTGTYNPAAQDISGLSPVDYTVTVGSYAGCTTTATYTITQPNALVASLSADNMICKNTTTNVYVTATGGTLPYNATGTFIAGAGSNTYTVTDANGCTSTKTIFIANGSAVAPDNPVAINSAAADATGLCGGGNFTFAIDPVLTATSYTWIKPAGSNIVSTTGGGTQVVINIPAAFNTDSVSVIANNGCGSSGATVKQLTAVPAKPSAISGPVSVMPVQTGLGYSVTPVAGLTYTWTVPGAAIITAGQNTASITATWGVTTGNVVAKAVNNCGSSNNSILSVTPVGGVFVTTPAAIPAFDTLCVNGLSTSKSFTISAASLSGTNVVVGPLTGYKFSTTNNGTYTNSVTISGYGTTLSQAVYVKFSPTTTGSFNGNIPISGGGATASGIAATAIAVNSSPVLTAAPTNITCNGLKNGALDLTLTGGTGPFTYSWTGAGTYDPAAQDISGLSAVAYTVSVGSYAGCTTTGIYTITQPSALVATLTADVMVCKNTTTNVYVTGSGGTLPYSGIGTFSAPSGPNSYTITDGNGCVKTGTITIANGAGLAPGKPVVINSPAADATGVCGSGNFTFAIDSVATATSYVWTVPAGTTISSQTNGGKQIVMTTPAGFNAGSVSVTANNVCGASTAETKTLVATPAKPAAISGPVSVTAQQTGLAYNTTNVAGVTYTWTVPGTGSILSGQNTAAITAKWGNNSGNLTVKAGNACGVSNNTTLAITVTVAVAASQPGGQSLSAVVTKPAMIMPNPAKDVAYYSFNAAGGFKYTVDVTSISGKLLQRKTGTAVPGVNTVKLDVHEYSNGLYLVTLINEKGERSTLKLVKE